MMLVLALGTRTRDADITTPCLASSKWNPVSAAAPHCPKISLARNTKAITGQGKSINTMILPGTFSANWQ
jgi:hypothetical protein